MKWSNHPKSAGNMGLRTFRADKCCVSCAASPTPFSFAPDHLREEADVLDFTKLREVK